MNEGLVRWIESNLEKVEQMTGMTAEYLTGYLETNLLQERLSYRTLLYNDLGQNEEFSYIEPDAKLIYFDKLISKIKQEYNESKSIEC